MLEAATGKPCYLMSHAVDMAVFRPELRNRRGGPFRIGYVGRLTAEKSVRTLARLEGRLAIGAVTRRFPNLQLVNEQPDWGPNFAFRGLSTLLVRV